MSESPTTNPGIGFQRAIAASALLLLAVAAAVPHESALLLRAAPVVVAVGLARLGFAHPGPGSAVAVLAAALASIALTGLLWQVAMPLALAVFAVAARREPRLNSERLQLGRLPIFATLLCAAVTPVALVGWVVLAAPNMHDITDAIPDVSPALLIFGAVVFAVLNAFFEEWIWRGVLQSRLSALFPASASIALQAASFGAAHAHGFPRGLVGVVLAGTWGGMLGVLRLRSGGMLAPVVAHVVADATIASIVLLWLR